MCKTALQHFGRDFDFPNAIQGLPTKLSYMEGLGAVRSRRMMVCHFPIGKLARGRLAIVFLAFLLM